MSDIDDSNPLSNPLINRLISAQIAAQVSYFHQHVLQLIQSETHPHALDEAIGDVLSSVLQHPMQTLLSQPLLQQQYVNMLLESNMAESWRASIADWLTAQHTHLSQSKWLWQDILTQEWIAMLASRFAEQTELRNILVANILDSEIYRTLISDVLYAAIRGFFQQENLLSKIPALSSLMKLGRFGLGKVAPGLEELIEPILKHFIEHYVDTALTISKDSLMNNLNSTRIHHWAEHIWEHTRRQPIAHTVAQLDLSNLNGQLAEGEIRWQQVRNNTGTQAIIRQGVEHWIEHMAQLPGHVWLSLFGLDQNTLHALIHQLLISLLNHCEEKGMLENWLKRIITPSYQSPDMQKALQAILRDQESINTDQVLQ